MAFDEGSRKGLEDPSFPPAIKVGAEYLTLPYVPSEMIISCSDQGILVLDVSDRVWDGRLAPMPQCELWARSLERIKKLVGRGFCSLCRA
jgi:hypothetical protein